MFVTTALKNIRFRNFFLADIISGFGSGMSFIGANWFILQYTGKNSAVGILMMLSMVSGFFMAPVAGTIADRFNRKTVLILSNAIRALFALAVAVTIFFGDFNVFYLYLFGFLSGVGWTIFIPVSRALVQEILSLEEYAGGSSLIEVSLQVGMFMAAGACGIVYKYFGFTTILIVNALTFFVSNYFLLKINYKPLFVHDKIQNFFEQFVSGWRFLAGNPRLLWLGIFMFIPFVATMSIHVILPGYVARHLHADSVVFGIDDMMYGLGACTAGFAASFLAARLNRFRAISLFFIISITALAYLVVNNLIIGLYVASFFFGLGNSSIRVVMNTQMMEIVPKSYMGRSQAVWVALSTLMQISSMYGLGVLADHVPVRFGFVWLVSIMLIGFAGFLWLLPKFPQSTDFKIQPPTLKAASEID